MPWHGKCAIGRRMHEYRVPSTLVIDNATVLT